MPYLIFLGFIVSSLLFATSFYSLVITFLSFSEKNSSLAIGAFLTFGLSACFGATILSATLKSFNSQPPTRDIHLTVPKDSSVNAQITSGNNTVNITDL